MHFSWSLPHLEVPHLSISGRFSLNPPRAPHFSVDWYAKAMQLGTILKGATIFGRGANGQLLGGGEAGDEMIAGVNSVARLIDLSVKKAFVSALAPAPAYAGPSMEIDYDRLGRVIASGMSHVKLESKIDIDGRQLFKGQGRVIDEELEKVRKRR